MGQVGVNCDAEKRSQKVYMAPENEGGVEGVRNKGVEGMRNKRVDGIRDKR